MPGPTATGATAHTIRFDGLSRSYRLYASKALPADEPRPVVVVLHGGGGSGAGAARQGSWDRAADEHGFLTVYPDGVSRAWNAGICCGPPVGQGIDDVGFVLAVLDAVNRDHAIDGECVYATGISNGGMMAYRLACEAPDRFAAIAPVAATLVFDGPGPSRPVALLHIHGLLDRNVPFQGGLPTRSALAAPPNYLPVNDAVARFVDANHCSALPSTTGDGEVTTRRWTGGGDAAAVELVTIADGGHSWPGGHRMNRELDVPSDALDATTLIWQFFAAHPRKRRRSAAVRASERRRAGYPGSQRASQSEGGRDGGAESTKK